jgi:hypothetical protein
MEFLMPVVHRNRIRRVGALAAALVAPVAAAPTAAFASCTGGTHLDEATITIRR